MEVKFMGETLTLTHKASDVVTPPAKTDQEKVMALFTELGIPFTIQDDSFVLYPQKGSCVTGYNSFYTQFEFQKDGKLANIVIAE